MSTGVTPEVPVEYLGFMAYQPSFRGGSFAYYRAGINMTTAWNDYYGVLNGINSYMGYAGGTGIQPGNIACHTELYQHISTFTRWCYAQLPIPTNGVQYKHD